MADSSEDPLSFSKPSTEIIAFAYYAVEALVSLSLEVAPAVNQVVFVACGSPAIDRGFLFLKGVPSGRLCQSGRVVAATIHEYLWSLGGRPLINSLAVLPSSEATAPKVALRSRLYSHVATVSRSKRRSQLPIV